MSILTKQITLSISLAGALIVAACSNSGIGGGNIAGIGGSGYISTGTITSFGSVFVNGVEFETNASTFEVEDMSGSQQDLKIGMVVQVSGSINADGVTGTASNIKYADDLEGPVTNIVSTVDTLGFSVFGNEVVISQTGTAIEGVLFADIVNGNVLEISGYYDQSGTLQASYVEFKSASSNANTQFEVKGVIQNLSGKIFDVKGIRVDASAANLDGFSNDLQNGIAVEVKGTFNSGTMLATEINAEDVLSEEANVEIEGIVNRFVSLADFDVNGQKVDASNAELSPSTLVIELGSKVEIEGRVSNGVLIASEVEGREGQAEVSAVVSSVDIPNNSFTVEVLTGQFITIELSRSTRMEDDTEGMDDNLLLRELENTGGFVVVQGFESGVNSIAATQIKRESEVQDTELQGVVTDESASAFTVLGVTFAVDENTVYNGVDTNAEFLDLTTDQSVISITVTNAADEFANEVELSD